MKSFFHKIQKLNCGWNDVPLDEDAFHRLCKRHEIEVKYLRLGVHGFYNCTNGKHFIAIGRDLAPFQAAFVMFHEFAHFLMHSPRTDATLSFCGANGLASRDEQEADAFAYCALLPLELLKSREGEELADLYGSRFFMERLSVYERYKV